jgi:serine/threonine protein phosphatase 1
MAEARNFTELKPETRIWAVASVHGEAERLARLHRAMAEKFMPSDQIVFLGNILGVGSNVGAALEEALIMRRHFMAASGAEDPCVHFLRGAQEEMWQKLLMLQMAPNPGQVLDWMDAQGLGPTVAAYGSTVAIGRQALRDGILALTRWTNNLRESLRVRDGHSQYLSSLQHAAYNGAGGLLFVHAGIDATRPFAAQGDAFWWGGAGFSAMNEPFEGFKSVVRGYERSHAGPRIDSFTITLDAGAGRGGPLIAGLFDESGQLVEFLEA